MVRKRGTTREVFFIHRWALKIPSLRSWPLFLRGLLANMQEVTFSKTGWPELCPVVFRLPLGVLIVMPRLCTLPAPLAATTYVALVEHETYHVPAENKPCSWGWYQGRLVAVDYGS